MVSQVFVLSRTEIHLRKGSLPPSAIQRSDYSKTTPQRQIPTSTSNNSGLYSTQDGEKRFSRASPNIEHKIESKRRSKRLPRSCTVRPELAEDSSKTYANPLVNDSLIKTRAGSLSQPPPPPPPPPPPAPSAMSAAKYRSSSTSAFRHQNEDQQLPRDSLASPMQSSYTRQNTIPSLPLPPSFASAEASSPSKAQKGRKLRSVSTAGSSEGNNGVYSTRVDRVSPLLKQTSPNSACGSILERKKSLGQRFSQFESSEQKFERPVVNTARFSSPAPRASYQVDGNNNLFQQRGDSAVSPKQQADNENRNDSANARKSKLIESLYYTNSNIMLNPNNKKHIFEAIQRQQMTSAREKAERQQRTTEEHIERDNPFRAQLVPNVSGSQLSPTEQKFHGSRNSEPIHSNLLSSIKALSKDNRIDTQTFYTMAKQLVANEETDPESSAHLPPPPSDFELNAKLSGYNSTNSYKEIKSMFDSKSSTPDASADFVRKPVMTNKLSKSYSNLRQAQDLVSSTSSQVEARSECNYAAGPRRKLVMKTTSLHNTNMSNETESPQRHKSHSVDAGHRSRLGMSPSHSNGAVKNLVMSYEEIPFKEENESKHKVQMLREQRNKEMLNVVEQSRMILHGLATLNEFGDAQKSEIMQKQHQMAGNYDQSFTSSNNNSPTPQHQQQQQQRAGTIKNSNSEAEIQSTTPCVVNQQIERQDLQNLLQKELSTISERTEHSSSANCLATIAGSTVNTSFTVPSPQITNAHSSKL